MSLAAVTVTVDCADARALAEWYVAAFDGSIVNDLETFIVTTLTGVPVNVAFQEVPESKDTKNRVHVDFLADDRPREVQRLVDRGATQLGEHSIGWLDWTVLLDPQGNEFCIAEQPVASSPDS